MEDKKLSELPSSTGINLCSNDETALLIPKLHSISVSRVSDPRLLGYALMLFASFSFSWSVILVRFAENAYALPASSFVFLRSLCDSSASFLYMVLYMDFLSAFSSLTLRERFLLTLRAITGALGMLFYFIALEYLPAGDATTLFFISPAFTMVISRIFLGEVIFGTDAFALLLNFAGLALVAQPGFLFHRGEDVVALSSRFPGVASGILSATCIAITYSSHRALGNSIHFVGTVFILGVACFFLSFIIGGPHALRNYVALSSDKNGVWVGALTAVVSFFGQCALSKSLQIGPVGTLSVMRSVEIPAIYLLGVLFLGEKPSLLPCIGSILVIMGTTLITLRRVLASET